MIHIGGAALGVRDVVGYASHPAAIVFADGVEAALRANSAMAERVALTSPSYGRTTGVGANRDVAADDEDGDHGLRLVRSHATGAGPLLGDDVARSTMLVRLQQLAQPGSGIPFEIVEALRVAANDGRVPPIRSFGGMGTGDITGLAELALCLLGERPWSDGATARYLPAIGGSGALALMSSSAPTVAAAAHAAAEMQRFLHASLVVATMSSLAVRPNAQQWSPAAAATRPSVGLAAVTGRMRALLDGSRWESPRTQDPLSFRVIPFVAGPLWESAEALLRAVGAEINAGAENPRYADEQVWHHGAFNLTGLALALDTARLAATQWCSTSLARLVKLHDPAYTGQSRFLAHGPAGSSGSMVLEYTAGSALETVRTLADPTSRHTTNISVGVEDHATFASRGAIATRELVLAARTVVACELVAAVRALRHAEGIELGDAIRETLRHCSTLPDDANDRPLIDDVRAAEQLLDELGS